MSPFWRLQLLLPLYCCMANDTEGISLRATKYQSEADDQASYAMDMFIGLPYQRVRVQLDTGTGQLAVPGPRELCRACSVASRLGGKVYDRSSSSTAAIVPCHSAECVHLRTEKLEVGAAVPTVCPIQGQGGSYVCPRTPQPEVLSGIVESDAAGQCKDDPDIKEGPAEQCIDHLNLGGNWSSYPDEGPCARLLRIGFGCTADMAALDESVAGTLVREVCPETCGTCERVTRFCQDNEEWQDSEGNSCEDYAVGQPQHSSCFESTAYYACPVSCLACGDCCTDDDACYFVSSYRDGTMFTGGKVKDRVHMGHPFLVFNDTTLGVFEHVNTGFQATDTVHGVLGLGSGGICNPSCGSTFLDQILAKSPQLPKLFALCLSQSEPAEGSDPSGSIDVGYAIDSHHDGPIRWTPMADTEDGNSGYRTSLGPLDIKLNTKSLVNNAPPKGLESLYASSAQLAGFQIEVDSGATGILLPLALYSVFAVHLADVFPTFGPVDARLNTSTVLPGGGSPDKCSTDRVPDDYVTGADFPSLSLILPPETDGGDNVTLTITADLYMTLNAAIDRNRVDGAEVGRPGQFFSGSVKGQAYVCNAIGLSTKNTIVLGGVFLESAYTVFDLEQRRIGFAKAKACNSGRFAIPPVENAPPPPHAPVDPPQSDGEETAEPEAVPGIATGNNHRQELSVVPPADLANPSTDAVEDESGLWYLSLVPTRSQLHPTLTDTVEVKYVGWTTDGACFDSTLLPDGHYCSGDGGDTNGDEGDATVTFGVGGVIAGWTAGLQLMTVGEIARFWIPSEMAYGDNPEGGRPAGQLTFDVQLVRIITGEATEDTTEDATEDSSDEGPCMDAQNACLADHVCSQEMVDAFADSDSGGLDTIAREGSELYVLVVDCMQHASVAPGDDGCDYANDGECDVPDYCEEGTDLDDCGELCEYAHDGECDDPEYCAPGTDYDDCVLVECQYTGDGECDEPENCYPGTDAADCTSGVRLPGQPSAVQCAFANDGQCDEPGQCIAGSDGDDCLHEDENQMQAGALGGGGGGNGQGGGNGNGQGGGGGGGGGNGQGGGRGGGRGGGNGGVDGAVNIAHGEPNGANEDVSVGYNSVLAISICIVLGLYPVYRFESVRAKVCCCCASSSRRYEKLPQKDFDDWDNWDG